METNKLVKKCEKHIKPKVTANSVRIDDNIYVLQEALRVYYANDFAEPNNSDLYKGLLEREVARLREENSEEIDFIIDYIMMLGGQNINPALLTSHIFTDRNK